MAATNCSFVVFNEAQTSYVKTRNYDGAFQAWVVLETQDGERKVPEFSDAAKFVALLSVPFAERSWLQEAKGQMIAETLMLGATIYDWKLRCGGRHNIYHFS